MIQHGLAISGRIWRHLHSDPILHDAIPDAITVRRDRSEPPTEYVIWGQSAGGEYDMVHVGVAGVREQSNLLPLTLCQLAQSKQMTIKTLSCKYVITENRIQLTTQVFTYM